MFGPCRTKFSRRLSRVCTQEALAEATHNAPRSLWPVPACATPPDEERPGGHARRYRTLPTSRRRQSGVCTAWAGLANALASEARLRVPLPAPDRIEAAARTAIQLAGSLAKAPAARANGPVLQRNWSQAEEAFRRAIDLNPSATDGYLMYVFHLLEPQGRFVEALGRARARLVIEPTTSVRRLLALIQVYSGDYEGAIQSARWVINRDPTLPFTEAHLARALYLSGRNHEALTAFQNVEETGVIAATSTPGSDAATRPRPLPPGTAQAPLRQMAVYAGLRDRERAFQAFAQAVQLNFLRAAAEVRRPEIAIIRDSRAPKSTGSSGCLSSD